MGNLAAAYGGIRTRRALSTGCTSGKTACSPLKSLQLLSERAGCGKAATCKPEAPAAGTPPYPPHPSVALLHLCTSPAPLSQSLWSQLCMKCLREGSEALCRLCCRIGRAGGSVLQPWRRGLSGAELAGTRLTAFSLLSLPLPSALQSSDVRCGKTSLFSSPTQGVGSAAHTAPCCSHCQHSTQALVPPQAPAVRFHACQQELPLP